MLRRVEGGEGAEERNEESVRRVLEGPHKKAERGTSHLLLPRAYLTLLSSRKPYNKRAKVLVRPVIFVPSCASRLTACPTGFNIGFKPMFADVRLGAFYMGGRAGLPGRR